MTAKTARTPGRITTTLIALALVGGATAATTPVANAAIDDGICAMGYSAWSAGRTVSLDVGPCVSISPVLVEISGPNGYSRVLADAMVELYGDAYHGTFSLPYAGTYVVTVSGDDGVDDGNDWSSLTITFGDNSTPSPTPNPTTSPTPTPTPTVSPPIVVGPVTVTPKVIAHPASTNVSRTANLVVRFNTRVSRVTTSTIRLRDRTSGRWVTATVTLSNDGREATINPARTLLRHHRYALSVSAKITSGPGHFLTARTYAFVTRR